MDLLPSYAIDNDDFLFKTGEGIIRFHNETRGTNHKIEDLPHYRWEEVFKMNETQWYEFEFEFYSSSHHFSLELNEGAKELIQMLEGKAYKHLVTARPVEGISFFRDLIARNFAPDDFAQIHMTKSLTDETKSRKKWEVCKENNLSLLLDDYHEHVNLAAQKGIPGILLNSLWSRHVEIHPLVTRARNLYEAGEIIQKNYLK